MKTPRIAVVYYSATGHTLELALAIAGGAISVGADVRLARVPEVAGPDAIAKNPAWSRHVADSADVPIATLDDLAWAEGYAIGSPSRFGGIASQLSAFLDTAGPLWARGALQDKAATAFATAGNAHGGQEGVLLRLNAMFCHWGSVVVPPGYTDPAIAAAGGNPYGISATSERDTPVSPAVLAAARYQGERLASFASLLAFRRAGSRAA